MAIFANNLTLIITEQILYHEVAEPYNS